MDLTLHALSQAQVLQQLTDCGKMLPCGGRMNAVEIVTPEGGRRIIEKLKRNPVDESEVMICTVPREYLIPGGQQPGFTPDKLAGTLKEFGTESVTIDGRSVVGKILCIGSEGNGYTVYLFPAPKRIEEVNSYVAGEVKERCDRCDKTLDYPCGTCGEVATCPLLGQLNRESRMKFPA